VVRKRGNEKTRWNMAEQSIATKDPILNSVVKSAKIRKLIKFLKFRACQSDSKAGYVNQLDRTTLILGFQDTSSMLVKYQSIRQYNLPR
jgi:hypothetical protein